MTPWRAELEAAISAAAKPGAPLVPSALLTHCQGLNDPVTHLLGEETGHTIYAALNESSGFISLVRNRQLVMTDERRQKVAGAVRWLVATMQAWRRADDPKDAIVVSLVVVAARLDEEGLLWRLLPDAAGPNQEMGIALGTILSRMRVNPTLMATRSPISEGEELDGLLKAETEKDWPTLRRLAEEVAYHATTSVLVSQPSRALNRFFPNILTQIAQAVPQIGIAMAIVTALPVEDAFKLGARSGNDYTQFASVCRLFNQYTRVRALGAAQEDALDQLLALVVQNPAQWASWMRAFVAHPYRATQIQPAIGRALAGADVIAMQGYLDGIYVQASWLGRSEVGACLEAFASRVPLDRRQSAWRLAFARWQRWNFGAHENLSRLTAISQSNLDFAIVGYVAECLSGQEREAYANGCLITLKNTELRWHQSQQPFMEDSYRIMSRYQPFAQAGLAGTDRSKWLRDKAEDYLLGEFEEPYWRQRYHLQKMPS